MYIIYIYIINYSQNPQRSEIRLFHVTIFIRIFIEIELNVKANGVKIIGKIIHSIIFSDDIAMVTETAKYLQKPLTTFNDILNRYLTKININKTKVMVLGKDSRVPIVDIHLDNQTIIQVVQRYKYLGSTLTSDSRSSVEKIYRITMVKRAFTRLLALTIV